MKVAVAVIVAFLAAPAVARAETTITARDVPLHGRTLAGSAPRAFDLVGLHWRGPGSVQFRTRSAGGSWSAWRVAAPETEDLPDIDAAEAHRRARWRPGNPHWGGPS